MTPDAPSHYRMRGLKAEVFKRATEKGRNCEELRKVTKKLKLSEEPQGRA